MQFKITIFSLVFLLAISSANIAMATDANVELSKIKAVNSGKTLYQIKNEEEKTKARRAALMQKVNSQQKGAGNAILVNTK